MDPDPDCGVRSRNEDPVLAKNGIRGSVPRTKGDIKNSMNGYSRKF